MKQRHIFSFEGGEYLNTMGASWFVSYMWHEKVDRAHTNWKKVSTYSNRSSVYNHSKHLHKFWLEQIVSMNTDNLGKNKIGLSGSQVKEMAKNLLKRLGDAENKGVKAIIIEFDKKSLVIPSADYDVFSKENYSIDDGTFHVFFEKENVLMFLDAYKKPTALVRFAPIFIENKKQYEIAGMKITLKNSLTEKNDPKKMRNEVKDMIKEILLSLEIILGKRTNDAKESLHEYKYYVHNNETQTFDAAMSLKRISYLQFLPELDYVFCFV